MCEYVLRMCLFFAIATVPEFLLFRALDGTCPGPVLSVCPKYICLSGLLQPAHPFCLCCPPAAAAVTAAAADDLLAVAAAEIHLIHLLLTATQKHPLLLTPPPSPAPLPPPPPPPSSHYHQSSYRLTTASALLPSPYLSCIIHTRLKSCTVLSSLQTVDPLLQICCCPLLQPLPSTHSLTNSHSTSRHHDPPVFTKQTRSNREKSLYTHHTSSSAL